MHLPAAHTDGDSFVFFAKNKVLHMGDDFRSVRISVYRREWRRERAGHDRRVR